MPAKSKSQLRALCAKSKSLCDEYKVSKSQYKKLPEKVAKQGKRK